MFHLLWLLIELLIWVVHWRATLPFTIAVIVSVMIHISYPGQAWVWPATLPFLLLSIPLGIWWETRDRPE